MMTNHAAAIEQIVQSVFSTTLNVDVERIDVSSPPAYQDLVASIQTIGESIGSIVLSLPSEAARAAAAAMLQMPAQEVSDADQQDVAAELVNMIGGNLKSVLPGPSSLSLPVVVNGADFNLRVHDAELIDEVCFGSKIGCFQVDFYVMTPATPT